MTPKDIFIDTLPTKKQIIELYNKFIDLYNYQTLLNGQNRVLVDTLLTDITTLNANLHRDILIISNDSVYFAPTFLSKHVEYYDTGIRIDGHYLFTSINKSELDNYFFFILSMCLLDIKKDSEYPKKEFYPVDSYRLYKIVFDHYLTMPADVYYDFMYKNIKRKITELKSIMYSK